MQHNWTPVLDAEANAQKCVNHCGTVWFNGGFEPQGECQPLTVAAYLAREVNPKAPTYMERMFGIPESAVDAERVRGAQVTEAQAFAEVKGYGTSGFEFRPFGVSGVDGLDPESNLREQMIRDEELDDLPIGGYLDTDTTYGAYD